MTRTDTANGAHGEAARLRSELTELTDALVATNDQLLALYRVAKFSAASLESGVAASRAVNEVQAILGAGSAAFVRCDDEGVMESMAAVGDDIGALLALARSRGPGGQPYIQHDADRNSTTLLAPVRTHGRCYGAIVAASADDMPFTTGDLKLVDALGSHLAVMLELSAMHEDLVHRAVMQRDHDTASALARAALNRALPRLQNIALSATSRPARSAGGDFYAAIQGAGGLFLALGDVSGKGLPAALVMTSAISATYSAFGRSASGDTASVLTDIETQLASYLNETGMFITMAVAHIDGPTGRLRITNAGQSPVVVVQRGVAHPVRTGGPPVGVLDPRRHTMQTWQLGDGDLLFIGSDGCTDQLGPDGAMFGEDRLHGLLEATTIADAPGLIERVLDAVDDFSAGTLQCDDLTAIAARRLDPEPNR